MKIVIFTEDLPPCLGGIAQWANGVARSLIANGHSVKIYMRQTPLLGTNLHDNEGYDVIPMRDWYWNQFRSIYIAYYTLKSFFGKPDLLIATAWNIGAFASLIGPVFSCKTMMIYHGLEVTKKISAKRNLKLRHCVERANFNIAVSEFTANAIKSKFPHITTLSVVQNGIDLNRFYAQEKPKHLIDKMQLENKTILMTLARVIERKGHDTVIKALASLIKSNPNIVYLIAGGFDATYRKKLEQLISDLKLQNFIYFTGYIPDNEILDYYNLCDIYIMVSKDSESKGDTEGFGITFLEANACEKPVIGSNVHGIPDAIEHEVNGFLVEPDHIESLISIIEKLLANKDYAEQIGKQGRQRIVNGYTWDIVTDKLISKIENE